MSKQPSRRQARAASQAQALVTIEERACYKLGMISSGEVFLRIVEQPGT